MSNFQLNSRGAQKGFTLIEMSIVLVIIGLIIGGILKGQELIDSSRQKNLVTQIDGLRSAVNTFNDRYSTLPGDFSLASARLSATLGNGTGNGVVGTNQTTLATLIADTGVGATAAAAAATGSGENQLFFCHLAAANLLSNSSSDCTAAAATFGNGSPLPSTAYPNAGISVAYGLHDTATTSQPRVSLWGRVHRGPAAAMVVGTASFISAKALSQIDQKYDDGLPGTGTMRSPGFAGGCPNATQASVYTFLSETVDCALLVDLVQ